MKKTAMIRISMWITLVTMMMMILVVRRMLMMIKQRKKSHHQHVDHLDHHGVVDGDDGDHNRCQANEEDSHDH